MNGGDSNEGLLYEQVASRFVSLIEKGTLQVGERVPSVRRMAAQEGVSISTVVHAYRALEDEGWLEARPQSGYYVRRKVATPAPMSRHLPLLPEPDVSCPECEPTPVSIVDISMRVAHVIRDPNMIQLGMAVCDPNIHPTKQLNRMLQEVARSCSNAGNTYNTAPGAPEVRAAIAARSLSAGCALGPDDVVMTLGCLEALNLCLRAVCEPGDTVVLESPTYFSALQAIEVLGLRALEVPTHPRDGIVLEALEEVLEREPVKACLLMPCFSNPLGSRMPEENKKRLVEMLRERQIPLIEDDIWADTSFEDPRPKAAKAYDEDGWVMLCSSFSKTLGPGYRVGWAAPGRWRRKVEYLKLVTNVGNPPLTELAVAEFLKRGGYDHHLRRVRRLFAEGVECGLRAVGCYFPEGTRVTRPRGGHMLWVELPPKVDGLELFEAALRVNISIAPGQIFSSRHSSHRFIRLNCAYHPPDVIETALKTLGQLVEERV
ncbi:PLP-dependent aminotransferase family protein [bacterium]|nr:MAG: PLP-dependent aminotransferase family protein [bacterium]